MSFIMMLVWVISFISAVAALAIAIWTKEKIYTKLLIPVICWMLVAGGSTLLLDNTRDQLATLSEKQHELWLELRECKAENNEYRLER